MAPTPDPGAAGLAEEMQRQEHRSTERRTGQGVSSDTLSRLAAARHRLRVAYVLIGIFVVTFALYPFLAASALLRYRKGQRLIPNVYHRIMRTLLGLTMSVKGAPSTKRPLCL